MLSFLSHYGTAPARTSDGKSQVNRFINRGLRMCKLIKPIESYSSVTAYRTIILHQSSSVCKRSTSTDQMIGPDP